MPLPASTRLNEWVTLTIRVARRYRKYSSLRSHRMAVLSRIALTATMESGQRSRSSKMNGRQRNSDTTHAAHGVKNCGEVATITSGRGKNGLARMADTMKLK